MVEVNRGVGVTVAKLPGVTAALAEGARGVKARADVFAAEHEDTGAYRRSLSVEKTTGPKGVPDYLVSTDDPGALAIEYGHMTPASKNSPGTFVPGKHILGRAAGQVS